MHEILVSLVLVGVMVQDPPKPPYEATVQVKSAVVRDGASSTAEPLGTVKLRDTVTVLEIQGTFARVKATIDGKEVEGWISSKSIMDSPTYKSTVQAAGGDPKAGAESHGYTKGFDPKTEADFKSTEHLEAEYAKVDGMESTEFRRDLVKQDKKLREFRKAGNLGEFRK